MDKVKDIFYLLFVKHMFWTLSTIILLMGLFSWWRSTGALQSAYETNKSKIDSTNNEVSAIVNKSTDKVYNPDTHAGMRDENDKRRREVANAWQDKYNKQLTDVLVWPKELSAAFRNRIDKILAGRPIEEVKPTNEDGSDRLVAPLREEYRNKIKSLLPELAHMINAHWTPQESTRGVGRGGRSEYGGGRSTTSPSSGAAEEGENTEPAAVTWDAGNQGEIEARFDWSDAPDQLPTTTQILYSMEDYWVLKTVMQIIRNTNTDEEFGLAELPHQATIRHIEFIEIGKNVLTNEGHIYRPVPSAPTDGEETVPPPTPATGGSGEGELGGALQASENPIEGRYVSGAAGNYQPISAETLKNAATSEKPEEAYLAVAKRMPVRMKVTIDQRKINKFLVECGNADLMLEVKQVRVNPDADDIITIAGQQTGTNRSGAGGGINVGRGAIGRGPRGGNALDGNRNNNADANPWDVEVEIYGIIYIFNPPSMKRLTAGLEPDAIAKFQAAISETAPDAAAPTPDATAPEVVAPVDDAPAAGNTPAADAPAEGAPAEGEPPASEAKVEDALAPAAPAG